MAELRCLNDAILRRSGGERSAIYVFCVFCSQPLRGFSCFLSATRRLYVEVRFNQGYEVALVGLLT